VSVVYTWHTNYSIVYNIGINKLATLTPVLNAVHFHFTCCKLDKSFLFAIVRLPNCLVSTFFIFFPISTQLHLDPIVPAVTFGIVTTCKIKRATTTLHLLTQV
jgi:hypothetical protein